MKTILFSITTAVAMTVSARAAETTVKISDVHLCCKSCVTGIEKAVSAVPGAKAEADQDSSTVTLTGADSATVQKAADAIVKAGYFGKSSDPSVKLDASTGAKGAQVQTLKVEGLHLCCPKCVKAVNRVLKTVPGVKANTAAKGVASFEITGDFNDQAVFTAFQKAGLSGQAGK